MPQSRIDAHWMAHPGTRAVAGALTGAGHRALFVGGCVRNALLGRPVQDIDIATDAHPQTVVDLAAAAGLKPVPTGIAHGTVTVVADHKPHEVTTFRRDVATDGRRAVVAFSDDPAEDAARRDFTMNALYAAPDGTVLDPLGGLPDLHAGRVRFIGRPGDRIAEDYLRILRFFRFTAWYGNPAYGVDTDGLAACAEATEGLGRLSRERVGAEMTKLLSAPAPAAPVAAMAQAGVLAAILPGARAEGLDALAAVEARLGLVPDPMRRLAAMGGPDPADRLRLSRAEAARLELYRAGMTSAAGPGELGYRHGMQAAREILALRAEATGIAPADADLARARQGAEAKFPVRPADLMPDLTGPALGAALHDLEAAWIASGFALGKEELLRRLD